LGGGRKREKKREKDKDCYSLIYILTHTLFISISLKPSYTYTFILLLNRYFTCIYIHFNRFSSFIKVNQRERIRDIFIFTLLFCQKLWSKPTVCAINMRLIQFNSGLRVVLKDVQQQHDVENTPKYYLAPPAHHSSNSSIATTSSSIKSNESIPTKQDFFTHHRQFLSTTTKNKISQHYHAIQTPPSIITTNSSTIIVEVGNINKKQNKSDPLLNKNNTYRCVLSICACVYNVIFVQKISTCRNIWPSRWFWFIAQISQADL